MEASFEPASAPASQPMTPAAGKKDAELWPFCDAAHPERGFCLSIADAKEIRIRYKTAIAKRDVAVLDEREQRQKAEVRVDTANAVAGQRAALAIGVGVGAFLIGLLIGGVVGGVAF